MSRRFLGGLMLTVSVSAASAAPLPDDPQLAKPVTLTAVRQPLDELLAALSKQAGITLSEDDHVGAMPVTVVAKGCPLRDLLAALAGTTRLDWREQPDGGYRLAGPAIHPPVVETRRLISKLLMACPAAVRPVLGGPTPQRIPSPAGEVYASLPRALLDRIEDGGDVPFSELPSTARRRLRQWRQESARAAIARTLRPWWGVPLEGLGLRWDVAPYEGGRWLGVVRQAAAAGEPAGWRPNDYFFLPMRTRSLRRPDEPMQADLPARCVEASRLAGCSVVVSGGTYLDADAPRGETPPQILNSVILGTFRDWFRWERAGQVWWLRTLQREPPADTSAVVDRYRKALALALPAEYGPFLSMSPAERIWAVLAPCTRLRHSLASREAEAAKAPLAVSELSAEQQGWLGAGLQLQMVNSFWSAVESVVGDDLEHSTLALDFRMPPGRIATLGTTRSLVLRTREESLTVGDVGRPMLRLLPSHNLLLKRHADLILKDASLTEAVARVSEVLAVPIVAEEPKEEPKLTVELRDKPVRLLLHWMERHTGLQWSRRGSGYIFSTPVADGELTADWAATRAEVLRDLPYADAQGSLTPELTEADRALLQRGKTTLSELSPEVQDALRQAVTSQIRSQVDRLERLQANLPNVGRATVRLSRLWNESRELVGWVLAVDVPGLGTTPFTLPRE